MKTKIITVAVIATALASGAFAYADSQTGSGLTNKIGNSLSQKFGGHKGFSGTGAENREFEKGEGMGFVGMKGPGAQLTETEKTQLESMTDAEKKTFLDAKKEAQKVERDAKENVIDKLINGETLTDSEKVTLEAIKVERAAQKEERVKMEAQKVEMEAKMAEIKPILEKKKAGTALTEAEQTTLDTFMSTNKGMMKNGGDRGEKGEKGDRGEKGSK
ncbi:MAG: hypothetical protein PHZ26_04150 [Candidatus Gracilibacteria bacterium]|nr:hypothetical protein [Candidatus Gracilibacteria bacterium]MDD2908920.1 hypothetical protein [Candidatus Gracilibacteria bacterium]